MTFLVLAAMVSTATPAAIVDDTWGALARSTHLHGRWMISLVDGTRLAGDWIIVNREPRRSSRPVYFVDSAGSTACWVLDADKPVYVHCWGGLPDGVKVTSKLALTRGTTWLGRRGRIDVEVEPRAPTLEQELVLFERIGGESLATRFKATVRREGDAIVFELPFRDLDPLPASQHGIGNAPAVQHHVVVDAVATIRVGPSPRQVAITARETARYLDACAYRTRMSRDTRWTKELPHCGTR